MSHQYIPLFIPSDYGDLFALYFTPSVNGYFNNRIQPALLSEAILFIPAFAEEMNKSRHLVAEQAQVLCEQGYSILVLDLFGTGDSQGDFSDATWDIWLSNIDIAIQWLTNKGNESISLWGLRTGVLLAIDFLYQYTVKLNRLICWQPVLNGENFIMQFLRLRIAAAMMDKNLSQDKTSDLKQLLKDGQSVEIAGYMLNSKLIKPMLTLRAQQLNLQNIKECNVFELVRGAEREANYATRKWIEQIEDQGLNATLDIINGSFFWATQEIAEVPALIKTTSIRIV